MGMGCWAGPSTHLVSVHVFSSSPGHPHGVWSQRHRGILAELNEHQP